MTYLDDIPFQHIGKGEQTTIKTKLALAHRKATEANLILLEEPENHLTHGRLNRLLKDVIEKVSDKQIVVATHSSFVANKLGLGSLILLHNMKETRLNKLSESTQEFFTKLAGYNTLRLLLCKRAILVEGDSDELVTQKAYMKTHNGRLPIEDEVDVISVVTAFLRFLEIAKEIKKPVTVITDNDGNTDALKEKYKDYINNQETKDFIRICFDENVDNGPDINSNPFNYNTLEPKLLKVNSLKKLNQILGTTYKTEADLLKYMKDHKTDCALKIFKTKEEISFPEYIVSAVKDENGR